MNRTRHAAGFTLAPLMLALAAASCDSSTDPGNTHAQFAEIIVAAGNAASTAENSNTTLSEVESPPVDLEDGTTRVCTNKRVSALRPGGGHDGFPMFDPNAGVVYPGSLLQGGTLKKAPPDPIAVKRAGGIVAINVINGSQGVYREVDQVTQAKIVQGMNDIIAGNTGVLPSNFTMSINDVRTSQQFALALGVDVETWSTSVQSRFSMRSDRQYSRVLVKLTQSYYTMSFQLPTSYGDLFAPEVLPGDLTGQVGPGNPATYISDVTYGRIYYMMVESTASQLNLRAAVEVSFNAALADGTVRADMSSLQQSAELNVSLFALGGEAGSTIRTFGVTDLEALRELFATSSDIRTGVPLSYVVRNVVDNRVVSTQLATEYDLVDCRVYGNMTPHLSFRFDAVADALARKTYTLSGGAEVQYMDSWMETISGTASVDESHSRMFDWAKACIATPIETVKVKDVHAGRVFTTDGPGNNPFVRFMQHRTPGLNATAHPFAPDSVIHVLPWTRFDGLSLQNSDFTIFAVVRSTADAATLRESGGQYFLFSNERDAYHLNRQALLLGFNSLGNVEMVFRGHGALVAPTPNRKNWTVYAFRFSQTEGWSVHVDNAANKVVNRNLKLPLAAFRGASLGLLQQRHFTRIFSLDLPEDRCIQYGYQGPNVAGMDIALLEAYTVAAGEPQIKDRMAELASRFGIF